MKTRLLKSPPASKAPKNAIEWHKLMLQVVARAQKGNSRHLPGLRLAMTNGQIEATLRRMGILSQIDIEREFPEKT